MFLLVWDFKLLNISSPLFLSFLSFIKCPFVLLFRQRPRGYLTVWINLNSHSTHGKNTPDGEIKVLLWGKWNFTWGTVYDRAQTPLVKKIQIKIVWYYFLFFPDKKIYRRDLSLDLCIYMCYLLNSSGPYRTPASRTGGIERAR